MCAVFSSDEIQSIYFTLNPHDCHNIALVTLEGIIINVHYVMLFVLELMFFVLFTGGQYRGGDVQLVLTVYCELMNLMSFCT